jgi:hypothetical protein
MSSQFFKIFLLIDDIYKIMNQHDTMTMPKRAFVFLIGLWSMLNLASIYAADGDVLKLLPDDTRLYGYADGSFDLYIRYVPGRESILLTDSSRRDDDMADNYSLRAYDSHPSYTGQQRILDGKRLNPSPDLQFLMTSTHAPVTRFETSDEWFMLHLPAAVMYGYPWGREGQFEIKAGTVITIRVFALPYLDYADNYQDNAFAIERRAGAPVEPVMPDDEQIFRQYSDTTHGTFARSDANKQLIQNIQRIVDLYADKSMDLVIVLDTTLSMKEALKTLLKEINAILQADADQAKAKNLQRRYGYVRYRDYPPDYYLAQIKGFDTKVKSIQSWLAESKAAGGRDIPEAVNEAMLLAINDLSWQADSSHVMIQIGDAPPHPDELHGVTQQSVIEMATQKKIDIHVILINDPRKKK